MIKTFVQSWLATEQTIKGKRLLVSIGGDKKTKLLDLLRILEEKGWELFATEGTHDFLSKHGVGSICVYKASEQIEPNVISLIAERRVDLILNIPRSLGTNPITDGFTIRRMSIDHHIPLITNMQIAQIFLQCLAEIDLQQIPILSWKELVKPDSKI